MKRIFKRLAIVIIAIGIAAFLLSPFEEAIRSIFDRIGFNLGFYGFIATIFISGILLGIILNKTLSLKGIFDLFKTVWNNKKLLLDLSKNDITARYAGSFFGIIWSFAQPISTIVIYWFVFQIAFKNPPMSNVPYFLWMASGLVPWFYFSDAWSMGTNAFIEYSYLVKKVVFKIDLLPFVKVISAAFVHLFFIVFVVILFLIYGIFPGSKLLLLFYYMFAMSMYVIGLSFITSSLMVFVRDLQPIMGILLQFVMWMTPIVWSTSLFGDNLGTFFKLNPLCYIINGYRYVLTGDSIYIASPQYVVYYWLVVIIVLSVGCAFYNKVKDHFADVL